MQIRKKHPRSTKGNEVKKDQGKLEANESMLGGEFDTVKELADTNNTKRVA